MSLINDALKRAQRQRSAEGTAPAAAGTPEIAGAGTPAAADAGAAADGGDRKRNLLILGLCVAALFVAVIFLRHGNSGAHGPAVTAAPQAPAPQPPPALAAARPAPSSAPLAAAPVPLNRPAAAPAPGPGPLAVGVAATLAPAAPPVRPAAAPQAPAIQPAAIAAVPARPAAAPLPSPAAPRAAPGPAVQAAPDTTDAERAQAAVQPRPGAPVIAVSPPVVPDVLPPSPSHPTSDVKRDDRIQALVDSLRVLGMRAAGTESKVLINDRVYRLGEIVDRDTGLKLVWAEPGSLTFVDQNGAVYMRSF